MGKTKSIVMDGRDIATNVFPNADFKFYITASSQERARRRLIELQEKDETVTFEQVLEDIKNRDYNDSTRKLNPLRKADDAKEIDTTNMTLNESIECIVSLVK